MIIGTVPVITLTVKSVQKGSTMDFRLFLRNCFIIIIAFNFHSCKVGKNAPHKEIQLAWASDYSEDGLDFLLNKDMLYTFPDDSEVLDEDMRFHALTSEEFLLAKDILQYYFQNYLYEKNIHSNERPLRLRQYFRQYLGYKHNNYTYVHVNLYTHFPTFPDPECLCTIAPDERVLIFEKNGGNNYGTAIIDMGRKAVTYFKLGNRSSDYAIGRYTKKELEILFPQMNF